MNLILHKIPSFYGKRGFFINLPGDPSRKTVAIDKSICYNLVYLTTVNAVAEDISKEEYA